MSTRTETRTRTSRRRPEIESAGIAGSQTDRKTLRRLRRLYGPYAVFSAVGDFLPRMVDPL